MAASNSGTQAAHNTGPAHEFRVARDTAAMHVERAERAGKKVNWSFPNQLFRGGARERSYSTNR